MDPSKDIYHKEVVPFLARRKKRHARSREDHLDRAADPGPVGALPEPPVSAEHFRSRHGSRSQRRTASVWNRALWFLVGFVVFAYFVALGLSFVIHSRHAKAATAAPKPGAAPAPAPTAAPPAPPPTPAAAPTAAPAPAPAGDTITTDIRKWADAAALVADAERSRAAGQADRARQKLDKALELNPRQAEAHIEMADMLAQQKKFPEAEEHLRVAMEGSPESARARMLLASILAAESKCDAALAAARWVLDGDPYSMEAHQIAGAAYMNIGQPAAAIDHLKKIVAADNHNLIAQNMLAQAYTKLEQHDKALAILREIQSLDPSNAMGYYNLAVCYAQQKMTHQALDAMAQAAGLFGKPFIVAWLTTKEFDGIRGEPDFVAFSREMSAEGNTAPATNRTPETAAPPTVPAAAP